MLTVVGVQTWLVDHAHAHMGQAGLSTVTDEPNPALNYVIWDGLTRHGIYPVAIATVEDADLSSIPPVAYRRFLLGCLISLKKRILAFYRSQVTQGVLTARVEFNARATGLAVEIEADEKSYGESIEGEGGGGLYGGPLIGGTNIPNAAFIPYARDPNVPDWLYGLGYRTLD